MDIKAIPTKRVLMFKYLACRLLIDLKNTKELSDFDFKGYINHKFIDRVGEKYFINNYKSKSLSEMLDEIKLTKDERVEFSNSIHDYIINKEFTIVNDEFLSGSKDCIILKPTNTDILKPIYMQYGHCNIFIVEESEYITLKASHYFSNIYKIDSVVEKETEKKYYAVIAS